MKVTGQVIQLINLTETTSYRRAAVLAADINVLQPHGRTKAVGVLCYLPVAVVKGLAIAIVAKLTLIDFFAVEIAAGLVLGQVLDSIGLHIISAIEFEVHHETRPDDVHGYLPVLHVIGDLYQRVTKSSAETDLYTLSRLPVAPLPQLGDGALQFFTCVLTKGHSERHTIGELQPVFAEHAGVDLPCVKIHKSSRRVVDHADIAIEVVVLLIDRPAAGKGHRVQGSASCDDTFEHGIVVVGPQEVIGRLLVEVEQLVVRGTRVLENASSRSISGHTSLQHCVPPSHLSSLDSQIKRLLSPGPVVQTQDRAQSGTSYCTYPPDRHGHPLGKRKSLYATLLASGRPSRNSSYRLPAR